MGQGRAGQGITWKDGAEGAPSRRISTRAHISGKNGFSLWPKCFSRSWAAFKTPRRCLLGMLCSTPGWRVANHHDPSCCPNCWFHQGTGNRLHHIHHTHSVRLWCRLCPMWLQERRARRPAGSKANTMFGTTACDVMQVYLVLPAWEAAVQLMLHGSRENSVIHTNDCSDNLPQATLHMSGSSWHPFHSHKLELGLPDRQHLHALLMVLLLMSKY